MRKSLAVWSLRQRSGARDRATGIGAAQAAWSNGVHQFGLAAHARPQLEPGILASGAGIKLPLESEPEGAASMLVDDDLVAFSHRITADIEDAVMSGISRNDQRRGRGLESGTNTAALPSA